MTLATCSKTRSRKGGDVAKDDKLYVANWLISGHKGKDIQGGDEVSMPDDEAAPLVACGAWSLKAEDAASESEQADEQ